ncbi:MAG: peptidylprolyl isomerase [Pseudomonadota bacterium]
MNAAGASAPAARRRWLREPLLWFLAVGAVLFWFAGREDTDTSTIIVDQAVLERLEDQWQAQMGRSATDAELDGLIGDWLKEEIYSREALAMGLDENDTIIRRRLVQKLRFLTEDLALASEPTAEELAAFYASNATDYLEPARYDFEHRYFSADRREDPAGDAAAALDALLEDPELTTSLGDPFLLQRAFSARSERQIGDLFGRAFAAALTEVPVERWSGPIGSAYGEHLVRVLRIAPAYQQPLDQVRDRVLTDLARSRRDAANRAYFETLKSRYRVIRHE